MLSSHLALPHEGHLEQVFQIFGYLKKYHNTELLYDPSNSEIGPMRFNEGTGCPVIMDMLMEKKNFPQYDRAVKDGVYHEGQG